MSENVWGGATSDLALTTFPACAKTVWVSGSYADPGQFVAVPAPIAPSMPLMFPNIGGVKGDVPILYFSRTWRACSRRAGVKSIMSSGLRNWRGDAGGF